MFARNYWVQPQSMGCLRLLSTARTPVRKQFKKVLVASRGEVALRVYRTLRELEIESIGIYAYEDRFSQHRQMADKSFLVGRGLDPVSAYQDLDEIINLAKENDVDAIHPGNCNLAKRSDFAQQVIDAGMSFIGPPPPVVACVADKLMARQCASGAELKVVPGTTAPITTPEEAVKFFKQLNTPIILKPACGFGGIGMTPVESLARVAEAFEYASKEAHVRFGDGSLIAEKLIESPRHIEVQVLADKYGDVAHLHERDCSYQRQHRRVLEVAPARGLDDGIRSKLFADAIAFSRQVAYENAGTVKFLVDMNGNHYFIGMSPRLQMEHCVTEEVTGIDLVHAQIRLAEGASLVELGLNQENIVLRGAAIQCQITSEDPVDSCKPKSGRLKVYRIGCGLGIRKDEFAYDGGNVSTTYGPLLCKVISHAPTFVEATKRMIRCLRDTRIRGIESNVLYLINILKDPMFTEGVAHTSYIEENPSLAEIIPPRSRGLKLLRYMSEVKVNGSFSPLGVPNAKIYRTPPDTPQPEGGAPPKGLKQILDSEGPAGFAKALRDHKGLLITDTSFRDAHQSLLATRVRTKDLLRIAPHITHHMSGLRSIENWGGATFHVCMNFLYECPWERLEALRKAIPNVPFQCIFRGANAFGYSNFPDNYINEFCKLAVQSGMDIFRIMDCLNYIPNLIFGIEAVAKAGGVIEAAIAYTGDVTDRNATRYNLQYYMNLVNELVKAGIHILAIKDMAGVLHPSAARLLIGSIREKYPDLPIQVHTHDTAGTGVASMIAAAEAGADGVDGAIDSMSGMTSQPSLGAIVRSMEYTPKATGLNLEAISKYNRYWEQTRRLYANFECTDTLKSGTSDVFEHNIPGGQYTNLQFQSYSLDLADQFPLVCKNYARANEALGDIIKVAPSSKAAGDLAQFMTQQGISSCEHLEKHAEKYALPKSVQDFFERKLGQPAYGFPKSLQEKVLRGKKPITGRPGATLEPMDFDYQRRKLEKKHELVFRMQDVLSSAMFPEEFDQMVNFRRKYGPVDLLPTDVFFSGPEHQQELEIELEHGKTLIIRLTSIGRVNSDGERQVHFEYNGQERSIFVLDREAAQKRMEYPKEQKGDLSQHGAPMKGVISIIKVKQGDEVAVSQLLFTVTSMKMEIAVKSKTSGKVRSILHPKGAFVEAGDVVVLIDPS
ncbi:hypothetical protein RB195_016394 [Necator americanus]